MNKYKQDIKPRNEKNQAHGYWEQYYNSGEPCYKGTYLNGNAVGYCEWGDGNKEFNLV